MATSATIRMYNQEDLGDCFLLKFKSGVKESNILIDFGSYTSGNKVRENEIAQNIKTTLDGKPLTVVLTHQHKDHLTGFISAEPIMKTLNIQKVWFSYLDDPVGNEAIAMRKATEKFWKQNKTNKQKVRAKFAGNAAVDAMLKAKESLDLFAEDQQGGEAISNLLEWSKNDCEFLVPGQHFDLPGLPPNTVRVYVLGPPTDPKFLNKLNPGKSDAVHSLNSMMQLSNLETSNQLTADALEVITSNATDNNIVNFPFEKRHSVSFTSNASYPSIGRYKEITEEWRRIDYEWLGEMGRVSLHMDRLTNNSSLVLAFELVQAKKVLLFVGDAQIGNWKSWFDVKFPKSKITARELLSRTVLYKAGHHSSHNATLLEGLDLMNEKELVIMIPVNKKVSTKMKFSMLKPGMLAGYNRKSEGRIIRSDTVFHLDGANNKLKFEFANKNSDFTPDLKIRKDKKRLSNLFIEYVVK